jgi:hypothetical protein
VGNVYATATVATTYIWATSLQLLLPELPALRATYVTDICILDFLARLQKKDFGYCHAAAVFKGCTGKNCNSRSAFPRNLHIHTSYT